MEKKKTLSEYEEIARKRIKQLVDKYCNGSQQIFADRTGLNKASVSQYINGKNTPSTKTAEKIAAASFLAMEAGADFIKTSTGKVDVNATPAAAYVMCECIARFHEITGKKIGFKPAGGISSAADALCYYSIVSTILGKEWLNKEYFRFGVSRVANSILAAVEQKTVSYF